jgi:pectin lyase
MKFSSILLFTAVAVATSPAKKANTISVTGSPPGFAYGVTGGGNAKPVYPTDVKHLIQLLGSDEPQVIIIDKTYDFIGTEGTTKGTICKAYGSFEDGCQSTIDIGKGCDGKPSEPYEWDTAGTTGISVHSDKTIIGVGNKGVLLGKGLRIVRASNIIVQNIMITNLNPKLVWGGDAITLSSTSRVWIDHVTVS